MAVERLWDGPRKTSLTSIMANWLGDGSSLNTLFVSDLDGTLLTTEGTLSDFSRRTLQQLLREGLIFTVATARSVVAVRMILDGITLKLPVIEFNGAFLSDLKTGRHEGVNHIERDLVQELYHMVREAGFVPFISTFDGSEDCVCYNEIINQGMAWYLNDRLSVGDRRWRRTSDLTESFGDDVVCFTVIGRPAPLSELRAAVEEASGGKIKTQFFENHYSPGWYWLTVHDWRATKAHAIRTLRERYALNDAHLVVFGDHTNDIEMFQVADRAVAVANATEELKALATQVIGPNDEDSVVRYLLDYWKGGAAGATGTGG